MVDSTLQEGAQPDFIAGYRVIRLLGRGGMASVYEVEDRQRGQLLALKLLHRKGNSIARFRDEFRTLSRLDHPGFVRVLRFGTLFHGAPYLTMELLNGKVGQVHVKSVGRPGSLVRTQEVVRIVRALADALGYLHGRGYLHRDIKSSNVLVLPDGRVKILDLGTVCRGDFLAPVGSARASRRREFVGTFTYASPEQLRGDPLDPRSDLYALGVLFYRMLTGRQPFQADDPIEVARLHMEWHPPRPEEIIKEIPADLADRVMRLLQKDRDARPRDMAAFIGELDALSIPQVPSSRIELATAPPVLGCEWREGVLDDFVQRGQGGSMALLVGEPHLGVRACLAQLAERWRSFGHPVILADGTVPAASGALGEALLALRRRTARARTSASGGARPLMDGSARASDARSPGGLAGWLALLREWLEGTNLPGVILLGDLHLSQVQILEALGALLRGLRAENARPGGDSGLSVVFVASCVPDAQRPGKPLSKAMVDGPRIHLGPLDRARTEQLASGMLGVLHAPASYIRALFAETGGCPAYIEDFVQSAVILGDLIRQTNAAGSPSWDHPGGIRCPNATRESASLQLAGLTDLSRRLLEVLEVAGARAPVSVLAHGMSLPPEALDRTLNDLILSGWLSRDPDLVFRVGVMRGLVAEQMSPSRRQILRGRIREQVDSLPLGLLRSELLVELGQVDRACVEAEAWALEGLERGRLWKLDEDLSIFMALLGADRPDQARLDKLVLIRARALARLPGWEKEADQLLRDVAVRSVSGVHRLVHGELLMRRGFLREAREILDLSHQELVGSVDMPAAAFALGDLALLEGLLDEAMGWHESGLAYSMIQEDRATVHLRRVAEARVRRAAMLFLDGQLRRSEAEYRETAQILCFLRSTREHGRAMVGLAEVLRVQGRFSEASSVLLDVLQGVLENDDPEPHVRWELAMGGLELDLNRLGAARQHAETAWALLDPEWPRLRAEVALLFARVAVCSLDFERGRAWVCRVRSDLGASGHLLLAARLDVTLALALEGLGRHDEAVALARTALQALTTTGDLASISDACTCLATVLGDDTDLNLVFAPVMAWHQSEPARVSRLGELVARYRQAESLGDEELAREILGVARLALSDLTRRLSLEDRSSMRLHPWVDVLGRDGMDRAEEGSEGF